MRALALPALLLLLGTSASASLDPSTFQALAFRQHPGATLPLGAVLQDASGRPVSLGDVLGRRPTLLVLEYLRCRNLCSLVLSGAVSGIQGAGLKPGRDLNLVALSIDPRENRSDLAKAEAMYSRRFPDALQASSGIRFFTASPATVSRIADTIGFPYRYDRSADQFAHPAGFVVTTTEGRISRYVLGLNPPSNELKQAVEEAAKGSINPPAHPLLLLCLGYDPDEGTVAALAMRLVRLASLAMVLCCAGLVFLLSRRRRSV